MKMKDKLVTETRIRGYRLQVRENADHYDVWLDTEAAADADHDGLVVGLAEDELGAMLDAVSALQELAAEMANITSSLAGALIAKTREKSE